MQQQLQPGTLLDGGAYRILKYLGQGSFGITYLAHHTILDRDVAVKEFFMKQLNTRAEDGSVNGMGEQTMSYYYSQKFKKEAQNLSRLDHPNIIRVNDSFLGNGTVYYAMEYIEGQNLKDYLETNQLSEYEAISIIKDVANALIYMHEEKHMLHLDIKPGNIMRRNSDGHIFLIDFGLSKHYEKDGEPETSTTIGLGTPGYAPVEQGNNAKEGDFKPTIDVYALGATLYKLLTHDTPPSASEIIRNPVILAEKLNENSISQQHIQLIVKAMQPNVNQRIQTIREFRDMLTIVGGVKKEKTKKKPLIVGISVFVVVLIATILCIRFCPRLYNMVLPQKNSTTTVDNHKDSPKAEPVVNHTSDNTVIKQDGTKKKKDTQQNRSTNTNKGPSSQKRQRIDRSSGSNHQSAADVLKSMQE